MPDSWSKPATALIDNVSNAVGGIAQPWQIKRVAKANAEAGIILANGEAEELLIKERARLRVYRLEEKRQENIENITYQAASLLEGDANPIAIDHDWIIYFFNSCQDTSDEKMQSLWAKILAEESQEVGKFSKRTIFRISQITKNEAQNFTFICSHTFKVNDELELMFSERRAEESIGVECLGQLISAGLISYTFVRMITSYQPDFEISYENKKETIRGNEESYDYGENKKRKHPEYWIDIGNVELTDTGKELFKICGAEPTMAFFERTLELIRIQNRSVEF
jgi:hypothetical protein